jgi:hypothetical protein
LTFIATRFDNRRHPHSIARRIFDERPVRASHIAPPSRTNMRSTLIAFAAAGIAVAALSSPLHAQQQLIIYPAKGQSAEQQQKDVGECKTWATGQTGFDPANPPAMSQPAPQPSRQGEVVRGAARGAVLGEIIDDEAGTGAAAGAAIGAMRRQDRVRAEKQQASASQQQQQQYLAQKTTEYTRALSACLEARSYTVK